MQILEYEPDGTQIFLAEDLIAPDRNRAAPDADLPPPRQIWPYESFHGQVIDGLHRAGGTGRVIEDLNPYTGEVVAKLTLANADDLDHAFAAAARAQRDWAERGPSERSAVFLSAAGVMERRHDEIVGWLIAESGSTRMKAEAEWAFTHAGMLWAATLPFRIAGRILPVDIPGRESRVYRRPLGVVGVISPWNFPLYLSNRSIAPALALGNAAVVKPADDTPVAGGLLLAKIYEEAGLPPGLLNVVVGDVADIGDQFTLHPVPKLISFTGSTRVGKRIGVLAMNGPYLKRIALELGGNSPLVVLDDADLDRAVSAALFGRFFHQGQICMSSNRIIVDTSVYERFVEQFVERARTLRHGDPRDPQTAIGPIINRRQLDAMQQKMAQARAEGIKQVLGGPAEGFVLPPHVFVDVHNNSALAQSELFGPIAVIIRADGEQEALRLANQTEYGLSSAVFTKDEARGVRFALRVQAGMTHVNECTIADDPNNMFGGEKNSGLGRFGGDWVISEFTTDHWVTVQHTCPKYPF
jgi:aldehyde dehydrogenase (NAD+)